MDFSEVEVKIAEVTQSEEVEKNIKKKTAGKGVKGFMEKFIKEDC